MVQSTPEIRKLAQSLAHYREPNSVRGVFELAVTTVPFLAIWALMWAALDHDYWIGLLLVLPAAGLLVRLFMIQHDCGHGSFFHSRLANDWVGRAIGVMTLTPYDYWRRTHALHHASSGNLDHRGVGDIDTLTVREFLARSRLQQLLYRLYRHPLVMFGIGPTYLFILRHRLPMGMMRAGRGPWLSTMGTNAAIAFLVATMMWLVGFGPFLLVHLPIMILAASIGVWLFYVQHQFEDTSWSRDGTWSFHEAALHGSSHYHLPGVLRWFTANIGIHHIHHLCSRIPCYRLPDVLRDHPELAAVGRITMLQSLRCVRMTLWDERERRLVSFREAGMRRSMHMDKNQHSLAHAEL
ncbi:fatty acid desaturase [Bradyrhizobium sp.]|uniref:fatty acid desaturase n=1 Tax=Bradyrhizobium sp. TaxID=376 RepID=UPI003C4A6E7D